MDDGKKKKKNKKNKGKPTKTTPNVAVSEVETTQFMLEENHESIPEQNHHVPFSGNVDSQNAGVLESEGELERHQVDEAKFVRLSEEVRQLQDVKVLWLLREANLEGAINNLQNEINSCIQKEASLENKIELLQNEKEAFLQKEASMNSKFEQLQSAINDWTLKEAHFEKKINDIESGKDSWIQKEDINEMIGRLEGVNTGLQMQVKELEESKNSLVQENQELIKGMSVLELRVQHLESEAAVFRSSTMMMTKHISEEQDPQKQMEPANEPVEKLVAMNSELVKKVNEPFTGLEQDITTAENSTIGFIPSTTVDRIATPANYLSEFDERVPEPGETFASNETEFETISIANADVDYIAGTRVEPEKFSALDEVSRSMEIVQIPLDDNQVQQVEPQVVTVDEDPGVPISDAPLIGAPFRIISFFAKYVSGADLVRENISNPGR